MEHVPMVGAYYSVATGAGPIGTVFFVFFTQPFSCCAVPVDNPT